MTDTALILEGGGMRGLYTAGVLDRLMEENIYLKKVYAVSAGACHACSYLSRQKGRAARTVLDFVGDKHYAGFYSFLTTGDFFGEKMSYHDIPHTYLPFDFDAFAAKEETLWAVVTGLRSGQAEYREVRDLRRDMDLIRASSSLPLLSRPVRLEGGFYLDGGVSDSIPLGKSISDGNGKHLVILTQHRGYEKNPGSMMGLMERKYRAYPNFVHSVRRRHQHYNAALALVSQEEGAGRAFVLQPKGPVAIGRLEKNKAKLRALYAQGYGDASRSMGKLLRFLEA